MRFGVLLIQKHCLRVFYLAPSNLKIKTHLFACRQRKCSKWHQMSTQNSPQAQNNVFKKIIILGTFSYKNTEQWLKKSIYREHVTESLKKQNITQNNTFELLKHDLFHFWDLQIIKEVTTEIISQIWDMKFSLLVTADHRLLRCNTIQCGKNYKHLQVSGLVALKCW